MAGQLEVIYRRATVLREVLGQLSDSDHIEEIKDMIKELDERFYELLGKIEEK